MEWFSEDVCKLIAGGDMKGLELTSFELITNSMTIDLNVFRPLMKNWIHSYVDRRLVVTVKLCWTCNSDVEIT